MYQERCPAIFYIYLVEVARYLYIYIIKCADNSFYTGVTYDLRDRYIAHETGQDPKSYTFKRRPFQLLYWEIHDSPSDAIAREKQIKGWSHNKKEALINQDFELLKELSKNRIQ